MYTVDNALFYIEKGRLDIAYEILLYLYKHESYNVNVINLLAFVSIKEYRWHDALFFYKIVNSFDLYNPATLNNIGNILLELNNISEAIQYFDLSLSIKPDYIEALNNKGVALQMQGCVNEALLFFNKIIEIDPNHFDAIINIGNILQDRNLLNEALISYQKALLLDCNSAILYNNIGSIYHKLNNLELALLNFNYAININNNFEDAYFNRCITFIEMKNFNKALLDINKVIELNFNNAEYFYIRGNILKELFLLPLSRSSFLKSNLLNGNIKSIIAIIYLDVLPIYVVNVDHEKLRNEIIRKLQEFELKVIANNIHNNESIYLDIGLSPPFYLSYQEQNNKELLIKNANIYSILINNFASKLVFPEKINYKSKKIKIGIVGEQIREHAVYTAITKGIIENINKNQFEIYLFHLGKNKDSLTIDSINHIHKYVDNQNSLIEWADSIIECQLDLILYPEIGMNTLTIQLACIKLAPIQVVSWGHPETTGLSTIDFFLSSELFETNDSDLYYSEKLVKLSNLGCYYSKFDILPIQPNINLCFMDRPVLLCPGTLYKYDIKDDDIIIKIINKLKRCVFIFFDQNPIWTNKFKLRLNKLFELNNLKMNEYLLFLPWLNPSNFFYILKNTTVYLDSIGFSGFNTAMQAIHCSTPIVAYDGLFLRGRLASGILKRLGINELIASTKEDYINLVVKIASDNSYRQKIINLININKDIAFEDSQPIRDLEKLFLNICRNQ